MRIFVTGTRGIPNIPGGIEKHCQELYPIIVSLGHEVILATRLSYVNKQENEWNGVKLCHIPTLQMKSLEAIIHTFLAVLKARSCKPDIVHVHAVGPAILIPFAKLLGLKVVFTNHGPDYNRGKWGCLAKIVLRIGEKIGGIGADEVIVISRVIEDIIRRKCRRQSNLIYNGVPMPRLSRRTDYLNSQKIEPGKYLLAVARFVPEKGLTDLIAAFRPQTSDTQLVIAGDTDHETDYSRQVKQMAKEDARIILTGYLTGENLKQVFTHARLFVLPSYHEGLPIALLEAMSYGLLPIVSDIPANLEVDLNEECYFPCGNVEALKTKIADFLERPVGEAEKKTLKKIVADKYNWDKIACQTINVYQRALKGR